MRRIVTGFHSIEEFLRSKSSKDVQELSLLYSSLGPRVKKIIALAQTLKVKIVKVEKKELDKQVSSLEPLLQDHKGLCLIFEQSENTILNKQDLTEFIASIDGKEHIAIFILDGISDCHNMGSIIRSADQFGIDGIIVPKHGSAGGEEGILKTSAGAANWMKIIEVGNLNLCLEKLKSIGFWIYATDMAGQSLYTIKFPNRIAIVMGSEGKGVSRLVKKNSDSILTIPTCGNIDSLNVSVAAGIIMYELKRQFALLKIK